MSHPDLASSAIWTKARKAIRSGGVVAFPTDTVYGIGCNPFDTQAIRAIYELKGRPSRKALPLLLSGVDCLDRVARTVPATAMALAESFWPGALTLVVERQPNLPEELSGDHTIAVRVPDHPQLRAFLDECGGFLATTSANLSGCPDARSANEVASYFPTGLAVIVDGGILPSGSPSTIIDCAGGKAVILREGAISRNKIEERLGMSLENLNV